MKNTVNALELRQHFGEIMDRVRYRHQPLIVTKNGRAAIVLLDIETYEASKKRVAEEAFIEKYTDERIAEFLEEDTMDPATASKFRKSR